MNNECDSDPLAPPTLNGVRASYRTPYKFFSWSNQSMHLNYREIVLPVDWVERNQSQLQTPTKISSVSTNSVGNNDRYSLQASSPQEIVPPKIPLLNRLVFRRRLGARPVTRVSAPPPLRFVAMRRMQHLAMVENHATLFHLRQHLL